MSESMMDKIKKLRAQTGAGIAACKSALTESEGDLEASVDLLRTKGLADLAKKSGRATNEGAIAAYANEDAKVAALIEVNCETDFVSSNEVFTNFVKDLVGLVGENNPGSTEEILGYTYPGRELTVQDVLGEIVSRLGENINITRFVREEIVGNGAISTYIHAGSKIGILVTFGFAKAETAQAEAFKCFARDVAMQVAATDPIAVTRDDFDAAVIEREMNIYKTQAAESGKNEEIQHKMAEGRLNKFFKEQALTEQVFVKDPDTTISALAAKVGKELDDTIEVLSFVRYGLGETAQEA